ncbi:MAG: DUF2341 domain-containing protein, partial [Candidatus Saccharibacteria bacterium]
YPSDINNVDNFKPSDGTELFGGSKDGKKFCISAVSTEFPNLSFHIDSNLEDQTILEGECPAAIVLSNSGAGSWAYSRPITITNNGGALTDYQVAVNPFNDATFLNNTGLQASYHFGSTNSGTITNGTSAGFEDMSGNNNNGTASNTNGTGMAWSTGKFAGAASFDGVDDYVNIPDSNTLSFGNGSTDSPFSIESWVWSTGVGQGAIASKATAAGIGEYYLLRSGGNIYFRLVDNSNTSWLGIYTVLPTDQWVHVAVTYDGSKTTAGMKIYLNGVLQSTTVSSLGIYDGMENTTQPLTIGSRGTSYFTGMIDELKVYNRILTSPDVNCSLNSANEICKRYGTVGVPKVRGDYADIRFTKQDGTELSYWQETDGKFWVKIPSLSSGDNIINMYYGNPSALSSSSGDSTFVFFDDFNGSSVDTNKWTVSTGAGLLAPSVSNGSVRLNAYTTVDEWKFLSILQKNAVNLPVDVDIKIKYVSFNGCNWSHVIYFSGTKVDETGWNGTTNVQYRYNYVSQVPMFTTSIDNNWHNWNLEYTPSSVVKKWDGVQKANYTIDSMNPGKLRIEAVKYYANTPTDIYVDYVKIRNLTTNEPSHASTGNEISL